MCTSVVKHLIWWKDCGRGEFVFEFDWCVVWLGGDSWGWGESWVASCLCGTQRAKLLQRLVLSVI